jgi:hypothetical protein
MDMIELRGICGITETHITISGYHRDESQGKSQAYVTGEYHRGMSQGREAKEMKRRRDVSQQGVTKNDNHMDVS